MLGHDAGITDEFLRTADLPTLNPSARASSADAERFLSEQSQLIAPILLQQKNARALTVLHLIRLIGAGYSHQLGCVSLLAKGARGTAGAGVQQGTGATEGGGLTVNDMASLSGSVSVRGTAFHLARRHPGYAGSASSFYGRGTWGGYGAAVLAGPGYGAAGTSMGGPMGGAGGLAINLPHNDANLELPKGPASSFGGRAGQGGPGPGPGQQTQQLWNNPILGGTSLLPGNLENIRQHNQRVSLCYRFLLVLASAKGVSTSGGASSGGGPPLPVPIKTAALSSLTQMISPDTEDLAIEIFNSVVCSKLLQDDANIGFGELGGRDDGSVISVNEKIVDPVDDSPISDTIALISELLNFALTAASSVPMKKRFANMLLEPLTKFVVETVLLKILKPFQAGQFRVPARYWRLAVLVMKWLRLVLRGPLPAAAGKNKTPEEELAEITRQEPFVEDVLHGRSSGTQPGRNYLGSLTQTGLVGSLRPENIAMAGRDPAQSAPQVVPHKATTWLLRCFLSAPASPVFNTLVKLAALHGHVETRHGIMEDHLSETTGLDEDEGFVPSSTSHHAGGVVAEHAAADFELKKNIVLVAFDIFRILFQRDELFQAAYELSEHANDLAQLTTIDKLLLQDYPGQYPPSPEGGAPGGDGGDASGAKGESTNIFLPLTTNVGDRRKRRNIRLSTAKTGKEFHPQSIMILLSYVTASRSRLAAVSKKALYVFQQMTKRNSRAVLQSLSLNAPLQTKLGFALAQRLIGDGCGDGRRRRIYFPNKHKGLHR